jgi:hypothetical protein
MGCQGVSNQEVELSTTDRGSTNAAAGAAVAGADGVGVLPHAMSSIPSTRLSVNLGAARWIITVCSSFSGITGCHDVQGYSEDFSSRTGRVRVTVLTGSRSDSNPAARTNATEAHRQPTSPYHWYSTPDRTVPARRPPALAM